MCSQQVELSSQVDFVNVEADYEPSSFTLIPPFGDYDYKE